MSFNEKLSNYPRRRWAGKALVTLLILAAPALHAAQPSGTINLDWDSRQVMNGCPGKITQTGTYAIHVSNVNDVLYDFSSHQMAEYQLRVIRILKPVDVSVPGLAASGTKPQCDAAVFRQKLDAIAAKAGADRSVTPKATADANVSVHTSVDAANAAAGPEINDVIAMYGTCKNQPDFKQFANDPVLLWVLRLGGDHTRDFTVDMGPDYDYKFVLTMKWNGKVVDSMPFTCGEPDILTLSLGPLVSTLPARTYDHQKAPVPPGSSTTQDILSVGSNNNLKLQGAALLNFRIPISRLPPSFGLALSSGPVYTLGQAPKVSGLGYFFGISVHFMRNIFVTPGIHIGEFADFPAGFYPGTVIPNGFGDLNPVKRTTARFAIGITYKVSSFSKSNNNSQNNNNQNNNPAPALKQPGNPGAGVAGNK